MIYLFSKFISATIYFIIVVHRFCSKTIALNEADKGKVDVATAINVLFSQIALQRYENFDYQQQILQDNLLIILKLWHFLYKCYNSMVIPSIARTQLGKIAVASSRIPASFSYRALKCPSTNFPTSASRATVAACWEVEWK